MKYKTTRKAIMNGCANVRCAGYCDLQSLLKNHEPVSYTAGVYGWNFDVFDVYGVTIWYGDGILPGPRLDHIHEYEKKAATVWDYKDRRPFDEKQKAVENLLKEFCLKNGGRT